MQPQIIQQTLPYLAPLIRGAMGTERHLLHLHQYTARQTKHWVIAVNNVKQVRTSTDIKCPNHHNNGNMNVANNVSHHEKLSLTHMPSLMPSLLCYSD